MPFQNKRESGVGCLPRASTATPRWAGKEGPALNVVFTTRNQQILLILPLTFIDENVYTEKEQDFYSRKAGHLK